MEQQSHTTETSGLTVDQFYVTGQGKLLHVFIPHLQLKRSRSEVFLQLIITAKLHAEKLGINIHGRNKE